MHGKHEGGGPECDSRDGWLARGGPASCCASRTLRGAKARGPVSWSGERVHAHQVLKVIQVPEVSGCH